MFGADDYNRHIITSARTYTIYATHLSAANPTGPCHLALARVRPLMGAYVPQCTDDGKYQKRQCHGSTGYCWCVNEDGAEVEGTRKGPSDGKVDCEEGKWL